MDEVYHLHQSLQTSEKDRAALMVEVETLKRVAEDSKLVNDEQKLKIDKLIEHNEMI